jgi:NADH-quinone oxidoreductase subunit N
MQVYTPELILIGVALILLLADAFLKRIPKYAYGVVGAIAALAVIPFFTSDNLYGHIYAILALIATALTLLLSIDFKAVINRLSNEGETEDGTGELYILPLIACAGITAMTKATNLINLFVALEVLTLTSYVLVGFFRRSKTSVEAGVKYLVLGGISTAILVFGLAWYFGMTGTFEISSSAVHQAAAHGHTAGLLFSLALLVLGAAFKIGAVPLQMWIPDVYQGAPLPTTAFLSVASKIAGFAFLSIVIAPFLPSSNLTFVLALMAAATLLVGNLGAIKQTNLKRLLGYSSIAQAGFILPFFLTTPEHFSNTGSIAPNAGLYLAVYLVMTFGAFFGLAIVRSQRGSDEISAFRGLSKTNPRLALGITIMFASLAGVPLTAGFLAKMASFLYVIHLGIFTSWLLPILIICATAGFYYYFLVIKAMYWDKPCAEDKPLRIPALSGVIITVLALFLIVAGVLPLFMPMQF